MNEIAFVIALLGLPGLLLLFIKTLRKNEHQLLKLFLLFAFISTLLLVPKFLVDNNDNCEIVLNHTYESYMYGNNFTGYHWDYEFSPPPQASFDTEAFLFHRNYTYYYDQICFTNETETSNILFKAVTWIIRIIWVYVFVYLSYFALQNLMTLWRGKFKK